MLLKNGFKMDSEKTSNQSDGYENPILSIFFSIPILKSGRFWSMLSIFEIPFVNSRF